MLIFRTLLIAPLVLLMPLLAAAAAREPAPDRTIDKSPTSPAPFGADLFVLSKSGFGTAHVLKPGMEYAGLSGTERAGMVASAIKAGGSSKTNIGLVSVPMHRIFIPHGSQTGSFSVMAFEDISNLKVVVKPGINGDATTTEFTGNATAGDSIPIEVSADCQVSFYNTAVAANATTAFGTVTVIYGNATSIQPAFTAGFQTIGSDLPSYYVQTVVPPLTSPAGSNTYKVAVKRAGSQFGPTLGGTAYIFFDDNQVFDLWRNTAHLLPSPLYDPYNNRFALLASASASTTADPEFQLGLAYFLDRKATVAFAFGLQFMQEDQLDGYTLGQSVASGTTVATTKKWTQRWFAGINFNFQTSGNAK